MLNTTGLNFNQLARIYVMANTPSYLYRHYKADSSVREFAKLNTIEGLINIIREVAALTPENRKIEHIVLAYAAIVALTFKNPIEVIHNLADLSLESLFWAKEILSLWNSSQTTTQTIKINAPSPVQIPQKTVNAGNVIVTCETNQ